MTRSIVTGLFGLLSVVAIGFLPTACQSGGLGDPCTPEDEYNPLFAGFKVTEENIESRSFQCQTRICLVNHFQGRVSCPLGQAPPTACTGINAEQDTFCKAQIDCNLPTSTPPKPEELKAIEACETRKKNTICTEAGTFSETCDPTSPDKGAAACASYGGVCNPKDPNAPTVGACGCNTADTCPTGTICDPAAKQCKAYVCHDGSCQNRDAKEEVDNKGKACCIPGTDRPVAVPTCGQCDADSNRNADRAVYCSCRCGVAEGEPEDENFNFCECPSGFECKEIRKNVGLGDKQITGKYCIWQGSAFKSESCGTVRGHHTSQQCEGLAGGI
jgi:hypothetical protein